MTILARGPRTVGQTVGQEAGHGSLHASIGLGACKSSVEAGVGGIGVGGACAEATPIPKALASAASNNRVMAVSFGGILGVSGGGIGEYEVGNCQPKRLGNAIGPASTIKSVQGR